MAYVSSTLKYRPQSFADVVGQEHVTRTLRNAVAAGRIHHAYLFSGPRGTGKTSVARVLAKALNCEHGPTAEPCGQCRACVAIRDGRAMDIVEIDAASNRGIDEIRDLREKVKYSPAEGRYKVYILDEVHMLTTEAFNALLKTLEEPPPHAFFILATTEPHRVPATIVSRCQRFDFRRIGVSDIAGELKRIAEAEGIEAEPEALATIARAADGGMRDAQSIFDQMVAYAGEHLDVKAVNEVLGATDAQTLAEITQAVLSQSHGLICRAVDRLIAEGKDLGQLLDDLMLYARDLSRLALDVEPVGPAAPADVLPAAREQARALGADRAMGLMTHLAHVREEFRKSTQHGLLLESALLEAGRPSSAPPPVAAPAPTVPTVSAPPARPQRVAPTPPPRAPAPAPAPAATPPPATPVAAPTPVPDGVALTLDLVLEHWADVHAELRRMGHVPIIAVLREGQPTGVEGTKIVLSFPPKCRFHQAKVGGEYGALIESAAAHVFRMPLTIETVLMEEGSAPPSAPRAAGVPPRAGGVPPRPKSSSVQQVKDVFPGSKVADGPSGSS